MRTDTITVKTKSGRTKTKYYRTCLYCGVGFYSWRDNSIGCTMNHFLLYSYENGLRDRNTIALKANEASRKKGYSYRIGKPIHAIRGDKHHAWKGGVTDKNNNFRKSMPYKLWRKAVFERDNFTCQICNKRGGRLNADHIKPFYKYPELRLEINNGRTLCEPCHRKTDTYGTEAWLNSKKTRLID